MENAEDNKPSLIKKYAKDAAYVITLLTSLGLITHEKAKPHADDETIEAVVQEEHRDREDIDELKGAVNYHDKLIIELIGFRDDYWERFDDPAAVEQRRLEANAVDVSSENKEDIKRLHPRR